MKKWRLEPDMKCRSEKVSKHNDEKFSNWRFVSINWEKKTKTTESQIFSDDLSAVWVTKSSNYILRSVPIIFLMKSLCSSHDHIVTSIEILVSNINMTDGTRHKEVYVDGWNEKIFKESDYRMILRCGTIIWPEFDQEIF